MNAHAKPSVGNKVYYLPGRGGLLGEGLGAALTAHGLQVEGRELVGDFARLSIGEQLDLIWQDLASRPQQLVMAVSYGAYLYLHTQINRVHQGTACLLSPVVGAASVPGHGQGFVPPRADELMRLADAGNYPALPKCQVHVGAQDWQAAQAQVFCERAGIACHVVPGAGHTLPHSHVATLLNVLLTREPAAVPASATPPAPNP